MRLKKAYNRMVRQNNDRLSNFHSSTLDTSSIVTSWMNQGGLTIRLCMIQMGNNWIIKTEEKNEKGEMTLILTAPKLRPYGAALAIIAHFEMLYINRIPEKVLETIRAISDIDAQDPDHIYNHLPENNPFYPRPVHRLASLLCAARAYNLSCPSMSIAA
jgi:hypothetical protein